MPDVTCHMPHATWGITTPNEDPALQCAHTPLTHVSIIPPTHQFGNSRATVDDLTYSLAVLGLVETRHPRLAKVWLGLHPTSLHVRLSSHFPPPSHVMPHFLPHTSCCSLALTLWSSDGSCRRMVFTLLDRGGRGPFPYPKSTFLITCILSVFCPYFDRILCFSQNTVFCPPE